MSEGRDDYKMFPRINPNMASLINLSTFSHTLVELNINLYFLFYDASYVVTQKN